jgi:hypothetical protein
MNVDPRATVWGVLGAGVRYPFPRLRLVRTSSIGGALETTRRREEGEAGGAYSHRAYTAWLSVPSMS